MRISDSVCLTSFVLDRNSVKVKPLLLIFQSVCLECERSRARSASKPYHRRLTSAACCSLTWCSAAVFIKNVQNRHDEFHREQCICPTLQVPLPGNTRTCGSTLTSANNHMTFCVIHFLEFQTKLRVNICTHDKKKLKEIQRHAHVDNVTGKKIIREKLW